MKKKLFLTAFLLSLFVSTGLFAQVGTNVTALRKLSSKFTKEWQGQQKRVEAYVRQNHVDIFQDLGDGRARQIVDIKNGKPVFYITDNLGAAHTTRAAELWPGGSLGLDVTGEGYHQLGEWDAGNVRTTHQEFTNQGASRVTIMDGAHPWHSHSTHVAGTLIAGGVVPDAKGMAYGGNLKSWEWTNDDAEMAAAAANGLELSNHSYGFIRGWSFSSGSWHWYGNANISPVEDYLFGFYDINARHWDQIAFNAPNYLIVKAAGNDRGEGPSDAGTNGKAEKDGGDDGFDCIGTVGVAKNIMTVGAVHEVLHYNNSEDVVMSSFSSWGPADDGRIKPDIVAKGVDVYSTTAESNTSYASYSGTSMATPNATGTMALIQKYYQDTHGSTPMRAATLKGLMLHTADEAGPAPGPDYMFGWGLMDAKKAAQRITDDLGQNVIDELVLNNGETYTRQITVSQEPELRVTICWTDPAGFPLGASLNPRNPMLVNDLNLKIIDPSGNTNFPWRLDPDNPSAPAVNDNKNHVDNVETVQIENPTPGTYTISVDYDGTLTGGSQAFSIIITGINEYTVEPQCSSNLNSPDSGATGIFLNQYFTWEPADFASSYDVYLGTDGGGVNTPTNFYNGVNFTTNGFSTFLAPSATYYLQVIPRNNFGTAEGCTIWSFTTMDAINQYPYLVDMENVSPPDLPEGWQEKNFTDLRWISTNLIGHSGSNAMTIYNTSGMKETDYNNWFISAPMRVTGGNEYYSTFYYKSFIPGHTENMSVYWGPTPYIEDLTNLVYKDDNFSDANWALGEGLIIPSNDDSLIFIGYHIKSVAGYGMFLDDMQLQNWGTVGLRENASADPVKIYNRKQVLIVEAGQSWYGASLTVYSLTGQQIYHSTFNGNMTVNLQTENHNNLYLVSLQKGEQVYTKKLFIR